MLVYKKKNFGAVTKYANGVDDTGTATWSVNSTENSLYKDSRADSQVGCLLQRGVERLTVLALYLICTETGNKSTAFRTGVQRSSKIVPVVIGTFFKLKSGKARL